MAGQSKTVDGEPPSFITWSDSDEASPSGPFVHAIVYRKRLDTAGTPLEARDGIEARYVYEGDTGSPQ